MDLPNLRHARYRAALTQAELADLAGVSKPTIIGLERGRRKARPSTARKLAAALGVAPAALMEGPPATGLTLAAARPVRTCINCRAVLADDEHLPWCRACDADVLAEARDVVAMGHVVGGRQGSDPIRWAVERLATGGYGKHDEEDTDGQG